MFFALCVLLYDFPCLFHLALFFVLFVHLASHYISKYCLYSISFQYCVTQLKLYTFDKLSSTTFCCLWVSHTSVSSDQISTFFNIYRHKSVVLTQFHLTPSSTKLHWPSTTKYQPLPPHTDPVPPNTNQHRLLLTQYHHVSTSSASHWPSIIIYQPTLSYTDQVPSSTNQYRPVSKYSNVRLSFVDLRWAQL